MTYSFLETAVFTVDLASMKIIQLTVTICSLLILSSCHPEKTSFADKLVQPEYWTNQALKDILPAWTNHVIDSANGSYFNTMDVAWQPVHDTVRFPSMIARHLFSYAAGYLLSGDEQYISMAGNMKDYLLHHAWDKQYGGWYDALTPDGKSLRTSKSAFVQLYVITGLTMYYFVTHDAEVKGIIDQANDLLEEKVWDREHGSYYDQLDRDWTLKNEIKTISAQLAPSSGYLLYLYLATRDDKYLKQSERIMDTILEQMMDPQTGWVLETFDKKLKYLPGKKDESEINTGHNIEVAWTLLRLYMINGQEDYLDRAKKLADQLHRSGFDAAHGMWYATIGNNQPKVHSEYTHWWIQAYGQMLDLCLARLYPEGDYITDFLKGAEFWDTYLLDKPRGDTYLSVLLDGQVKDDRKANQFKASYHSMEQCLLNTLYLACWINRQPVTLHFKLTEADEGEILHLLPIEMFTALVKEVSINNQPYRINAAGDGVVKLPSLRDAAIAVTVTSN